MLITERFRFVLISVILIFFTFPSILWLVGRTAKEAWSKPSLSACHLASTNILWDPLRVDESLIVRGC